MDFLSWNLLKLAAIVWFMALIAFFFIAWPISAFVFALLVWSFLRSRSGQRLTTLGSARFAEERDLERAGMLDAETGLMLGRIDVPVGMATPWLRLFRYWRSGTIACREFFAATNRRYGRLVRLPRAVHTVVFAPSGAGKGVSFVVPFLRTCEESCVVVDFKGELAKLTAEHRRRQFGHEIVLLDPFSVVTKTPGSYNPLDEISADHATALDDCNDLAKSLVVRPADERDPHWNDSAESWIAAMMATVVRYGDQQETRSLQTVRDFLSQPARLEMAIKLMCESDAWNGMLARLGGQLTHFVDREKSSTLSTVSRHLRFLDTPALAAHTATSSFDPQRLRTGKMTVYLILPPEHMRAQSGLLRMWIGGLLRSAVRGGPQESRKVHFVIDEAASLGRLEALDDAIDKFRGYGVRLQCYYQSPGQLKKCFAEGQDQTLLSNAGQVFFGVNDTATAELVSTRLGEATIIVESGSTSSGGSWQNTSGMSPSESSGSSWNSTQSWQQQARKLLKPEEVMQLPPRVALTFLPGMPPIATELLRYYEEPDLGRQPTRFQRWSKSVSYLGMSLILCGASCGVLLMLLIALRVR